jgi:hypothetical protein
MRYRRSLVCLTALAVLAALTAGTSAQASGSSRSAAPSSGRSLGGVTTVQLVTGDVVRLRTDGSGRQTAQIIKAQHSGPGSVFQSFTRGGDQYVVPQSAVPYLGSRLDAGLFDVTRLAQHPASDLSVRVHLRGGSAATLTGLAVKSRTGSTVSGSFSATSAKAFGRALARQSMRDHASPTHTTGLFRGIAKVTSAAGTARSETSPSSPADHVLTIKATDWAGNPDNGDSYNIYNVDDINLSQGVTFVNGTAQITVPDGHYSAVGYFYDFQSGTIYQVTLSQFTVKKDKTVSIDARDATSAVSITTPKPSTPFSNAMVVGRSDANGVVASYSFTAGDQPFFVAPITQAPSIGHLYFGVYTRAFSASSKNPYSYDLKYGSVDKISADQSYQPSGKSLAAVTSKYGADHPDQQSLDARFGAFVWESFLIAADATHPAPLTRTEYYNADKTLYWSGVDYQVYVANPFTIQGEIDSSWRTYKAGYRATQPWGDDPSHPRLLEHNIYLNQVVCPACISGSTLDGLAFPFGDNSDEHRTYPDQAAAGLSESADWSVSADGNVVQQGTGVLVAAASVGSASTYSIAYDTTRSSDDFSLSTETHTVWKVPADAPQSDLPAGWTCTLSGGTGCTVLPLMTVDYGLPSNLLGEIPAGDASGSLTIGHLAGADVNVTSLKVKVSYDGGSTYENVTVTDNGNGKFGLAFTVPKPGQTDGYGALSISAKDKNGSTLKETITRAFAVTAA